MGGVKGFAITKCYKSLNIFKNTYYLKDHGGSSLE
jgi:hypothetical protein